MITICFSILFLSLGCTTKPSVKDAKLTSKPVQVFLVRHAEKVDNSRDPQLSESGRERADLLALILRDAELDYIHSSDYIRTRETASPIAQHLSRDIDLYNPGDLPALAEKLRSIGGGI